MPGSPATCVFRGVEGFGASRRINTSRILSPTGNLPAMIVIVDTAAHIAGFLPQLAALRVRGLVAYDDVVVVSLPARDERCR